MKKIFSILFLAIVALTSCKKFLQEKPTGFLTPADFYKTATQIQAAVNGAYLGLNNNFESYIGVSVSPVYDLEYITGYATRPRPSGQEDLQYLHLTKLDQGNGSLGTFWNATYLPLENCNSILANLPKSTAISDDQK
ncbi:MAG: RagB/SusD family nutrient uptake outer membrane protein, partial [Mucilaginibacter sp.]